MYQIERKNLPDSKIELTGELPAPMLESAWQEAARKANANARVPGFRPGKVPEDVLAAHVGAHSLLQEAAGTALQKAWPEIVRELRLEAIGQPDVSVTKLARGNPLGFRIVTQILPEVALPDYMRIAAGVFSQKDNTEVTEKDMIDVLERLRHIRAARDKNTAQPTESSAPVMPELNNEFAKGAGFETMEELKNAMRENLRLEKKTKARERKRAEALERIAADASVEVPAVLAEAERDKMIMGLRAELNEAGLSWEEYLKHINKTEEELKNGWMAEGEKRARFGLVLRAIIEKEGVKPAEKEVSDVVTRLRERPDAKNIDDARLKAYAYDVLTNEKVFQLLEKPTD